MASLGMLIVALAIIGLIYGLIQRAKAGRVADAPMARTGDAAQRGVAAAGPKGAIAVEGNVLCQQPLLSPVTGTPCLFYELEVTASWKEGEQSKEKRIAHDKAAAQFALDDGSGPVWIEAREGGDFEPTQRKVETKGTGLLGGITGADLAFGNYRIATGMFSMGTRYTVNEKVMPVVQRMYACGKATASNTIAAPGWRSLILSNKSRDQLLASAQQGAKTFLIGGGVALAAGAALAIVGNLVGGGEAKAAGNPDGTSISAAASTADHAGATPAKAGGNAGAARPTGPTKAASTSASNGNAAAQSTGNAPAATAAATAAPAPPSATPKATAGATAKAAATPAPGKPAAPSTKK